MAGGPDIWDDTDLEIMVQWKNIQASKCPGCGRPLSQHLHNKELGREEMMEDYEAYSLECPAQRALSHSQHMWQEMHKGEIKGYHDGHSPDPSLGVYWITKHVNEALGVEAEESV